MKITTLKGQAILPFIPGLAALRLSLFKDYPYLYEGDLAYEKKYLQTYVDCDESVMIIVQNGDAVVGASTAIPLQYETPECQAPFIAAVVDINKVFYFGESVLDRQYRGQGIYRLFFQAREAAATAFGASIAAFCGVEREHNHPRRPEGYQPLDDVWQNFGYKKQPDMRTFYSWKEINEAEETSKPMVFWRKDLVADS